MLLLERTHLTMRWPMSTPRSYYFGCVTYDFIRPKLGCFRLMTPKNSPYRWEFTSLKMNPWTRCVVNGSCPRRVALLTFVSSTRKLSKPSPRSHLHQRMITNPIRTCKCASGHYHSPAINVDHFTICRFHGFAAARGDLRNEENKKE